MEERKKTNVKFKDPLPFEKWIFRNAQPDRDDNRRINVARDHDSALPWGVCTSSRYFHHAGLNACMASRH